MAETTEAKPFTDRLSVEELNTLCEEVEQAVEKVVGKYGVATQLGVLVGAMSHFTRRAIEAGVPMRVVAAFYDPVIQKLELCKKREETKH